MKLILTALILLGSSASFAGSAANDPVVSSLRARFAKAFVPTAEQLKLGKTWDCREFEAMPNSIGFYSYNRTFRSFDGLVEMDNDKRGYETAFVATSQGLVSTATYKEVIHQTTIRIDGKNNLLIENSTKARSNTDKETIAEYQSFDKSVAASGSVALSYNVCITK
jgi:hypothetical protein